MIDQLKSRYLSLPERDQRSLLILLVFLMAVLLYWLIVSPSYEYYKSSRQAFEQNKALIGWINDNRQALRHSQSQQRRPQNRRPLLQIVSSSADRHQLKVSRVQPEGNQAVRVWLNKANFAEVLPWMQQLSSHSLNILSVNIDKTDTPGVVNIQCLFAQG